MKQDRPAELVDIARRLAAENPDFQAVLGPGEGDRATHSLMRQLRERVCKHFGVDYSEKKICGETSLAVDFYFPEEEAGCCLSSAYQAPPQDA